MTSKRKTECLNGKNKIDNENLMHMYLQAFVSCAVFLHTVNFLKLRKNWISYCNSNYINNSNGDISVNRLVHFCI